MKLTVAHILRKHSQLKASFIINQIKNHDKFHPVVLYKTITHKRAGGFAEIKELELQQLGLSDKDNLFSKLKFKLFKLISNEDIKLIKHFIQKHEVKIIHFHYGTDTGIYLPFLIENKIPSVVSFYGYDCSGFPGYFFGFGKRYLNNRVFPYVTKVLAMSPDMKKDLIQIGCSEEKIIVHHHGNDVNKFYLERNYNQNNEIVRFLIISGLTPQKGHLFLLESFKNAAKKIKNIKLTIIGDGILRKKIAGFIMKNDLSDIVDFKRSVVYGSMEHLEYLKSHDIFIHPSVTDVNGDKEGIPGSIVEAMASGLPVISTNHAGIPYIIENRKTGLLVDEFDYNGLTDSIVELAGNERMRKQIGNSGQKYVKENLSLNLREAELENIYLDLIQN